MIEILNSVDELKPSPNNTEKKAKTYEPYTLNTNEPKDDLPNLDSAYEETNKKDEKDWEDGRYKRDGKDIYYSYLGDSKYYKIDEANTHTFRFVASGYAEDKNKVYFEGKEIPNGGKNIIVSNEGGYAKDDKNVYYRGTIIEGISPNQFDVKGLSKVEGSGFFNEIEKYYKDTNNVYYKGKIISNDAKNFSYAGMINWEGYSIGGDKATVYFKDTENAYSNGEKEQRKIDFFGKEDLGCFIRIDDKIYYENGSAAPITDKEIVGADAESFQIVDADAGLFKDKFYTYDASLARTTFGVMPKIDLLKSN